MEKGTSKLESNPLKKIKYHELVKIKLNSSDFQILSLEVTEPSERTGFMGDHFHIKIEVQRTKSTQTSNGSDIEILSFFAKVLPAAENFNKFVSEMRGFEKEVFFYNIIAKEFGRILKENVTFPTCYLADQTLIVLEDMRQCGSVPFKDTKESVNINHCKKVLSALARFHSASIIKEVTSQTSLQKLYPEIIFENVFVTTGMWGRWLDAGLMACEELLGHLPRYKDQPMLIQQLKQKFPELKYTFLKCLDPDSRFCNVIGHGDCWISNVLFKYKDENPENAILIDFQALRYGPPALDVQLFLYLSIDYKEDRPQIISKLQNFYYRCLGEELAKNHLDIKLVLPESEFKLTCISSELFASVAVCMYYQIMQMNSEFMAKVFQDEELYKKYMLEDRSKEIKRFFQTDKQFRKAMNNAMEGLIDVLLRDSTFGFQLLSK